MLNNMEEIITSTTTHKQKAEEILARFNEHGAKPGTVGYEIAKQYTVRGLNLLMDEVAGTRSPLRNYYEAIKDEVIKLK
jgi:hypothetical protein